MHEPLIVLVTPALARANNGNWQTALRWAHWLRQAYRVRVTERWDAGDEALMIALLEPTDKLMEAEREGNFTRRLALLEEFKMLPAGIVFDEYCRRHDMPGADWAAKL